MGRGPQPDQHQALKLTLRSYRYVVRWVRATWMADAERSSKAISVPQKIVKIDCLLADSDGGSAFAHTRRTGRRARKARGAGLSRRPALPLDLPAPREVIRRDDGCARGFASSFFAALFAPASATSDQGDGIGGYDAEIPVWPPRRTRWKQGRDPRVTRALRKRRSPYDLRLEPSRLRLWLQILRERTGRLDVKSRRRRDGGNSSSPSNRRAEKKSITLSSWAWANRSRTSPTSARDSHHQCAVGPRLGARHITVSTSGGPPQIRQLAKRVPQFHSALSLHGATDEVR